MTGLGTRAVRRFIEEAAFSGAELAATLANESLDDLAKKEYLADHLVRTCSFKRDRFDAPDHKTFTQKFIVLPIGSTVALPEMG